MRDGTQTTTAPARLYSRVSASINSPGTLVVWRDETGEQHTRTWPNALPGHRTPCRVDASKGLRQHRCSTAHRELVTGYRAIREVEERACEDYSKGWEADEADYWAAHPRTTFKDYLLGLRETRRDATA